VRLLFTLATYFAELGPDVKRELFNQIKVILEEEIGAREAIRQVSYVVTSIQIENLLSHDVSFSVISEWNP
jgi:hypothetical protein